MRAVQETAPSKPGAATNGKADTAAQAASSADAEMRDAGGAGSAGAAEAPQQHAGEITGAQCLSKHLQSDGDSASLQVWSQCQRIWYWACMQHC